MILRHPGDEWWKSDSRCTACQEIAGEVAPMLFVYSRYANQTCPEKCHGRPDNPFGTYAVRDSATQQ